MPYEEIARIAGITSLVWFLGIFAAVIVYTFWPKNRKRFDDAAAVPLRED